MNPQMQMQQQQQQMDPVQRYESDKRAWDEAIRAYNGPDPLDMWFNFICWLEQHKMYDKDGGFRKILEQCLSNFENFENYKQDVRMVKLWMKFIDMQANPLNLYQFLYKKNVGTQCACFYIGWAHYYDAANAFKQAESIYNLGIQVKAQPMEELQEAQNKFRLSIAQRMLYNDASSKKRSANTLVEQRQQITSLSPPQKKFKSDNGDYYQNQPQETQQVQSPQPQAPVPVGQNLQQQQPQQHNLQSHYNQPNYYHHQQQTDNASPVATAATAVSSASSTMTSEQYYQQDKQNNAYYQNAGHYQQHQSAAVQAHVPVQQTQPQHQLPVQRPVQPPPQQQQHIQMPMQQPIAQSVAQQPAAQPVPAQVQPQARPQPQQPPQSSVVQPVPAAQSQPEQRPPVASASAASAHKSVIIENYGLTMENDSLIECNLNNSAYVISSSLNYVYDDPNLTGYTLDEEEPAAPEEDKFDPDPSGIRLPVGFIREARSNHERWDVPLCLEEPYDANRKCCYPKGIVYPDLHTGKPTMEFSMEEIRARKWYRRKEELEEQTKQKQQQLELERQRQERQRQLQMQYQQQQQQMQQVSQPVRAQHANYGHPPQQHQPVPQQRGYQQQNQYGHSAYQQQQPPMHQYQQPARPPVAAVPVQQVPPSQPAGHYYNQQQHIHQSPAQPIQHSPAPVQHSPAHPVQHPPMQNNYAHYRHPQYPQQPNQPYQQAPVPAGPVHQQPVPAGPVHQQQPVHHGPVHQQQSVQHGPVHQHQPVQHGPVQQHQPVQHGQQSYQPQPQQNSPYHQNSHYGNYPHQNFNNRGQPVHHSPVQTPSPHHHYSPQPHHHHAVQQHQQQPSAHQIYAPHTPPARPHTPGQQVYHHHQPAVPPNPQQQQVPIQHRPPAQPYGQPGPPVPQTMAMPRSTPMPQQQQQPHQPPKPTPVPVPQHPQQAQPPQIPQPNPPVVARPPATSATAAPAGGSNRFSNCDDFEEQIEASTIRFSTSTENGTSKSKTITIKFKKEKTTYSPSTTATPSPPMPVPAAAPPTASSSSEMSKKPLASKKVVPSIARPPPPPMAAKEKVGKNATMVKKHSSGVKTSKTGKSKYDSDATLVPAGRSGANRTDANLLLSLSGENDESSGSYASSGEIGKKKSKKKAPYINEEEDEDQFDEDDDDEFLDSEEEEEDDDEDEDDEDEEDFDDSSYQSNSEFNTSFSNISFAGDNSNGAFNFGGSSCSTPLRHTQTSAGAISKTSTPIGSFRYLKKHESNLSLGQNEDSMSSTTVVENSYFQTEHDEEAKRRRKEKALAIIETHLNKPFLDPFSGELCKAFLTKIDFPSRENTDDYKVTNNNLPKLIKSQMCSLGGKTYNIEKEVGRGSYGSVYRALATGTGATVAIKYQKPANTWELYICTEVRKRIKNPDILSGFMDICSAVIAPNASVLVSEFSQYGSLLDINNKIRTATTKVMHETLVMHFSSQILSIVDHLHRCNIIHADIKPDNFLLMQIPTVESDVPTLRLIDFGCAIDMNFFEKKRQFKKVIQTDGFTCIEMQEGRPWSFQTDLFCVAGTIHVMLFGEYMQLTKKYDQNWDIKQKLPRYLKKHVWTEVFQKLLNIKDINHMPKLDALKELIDGEVFNMESELMKHIRTLSNLLKRR